jgi:transposase
MEKTPNQEALTTHSLETENRLLHDRVTSLKDQNTVLQDRAAVLEDELQSKTVEVEHWKRLYLSATQKLYGKKSEAAISGQLVFFDEAENENTIDVLEHTDSDEQLTQNKATGSTKRLNRSRLLTCDADTPVVEFNHEGTAPFCQCGSPMKQSGSFVREAIAVIPSSKVVVRHVYPQYQCSSCQGEEGEERTITITEEDTSLLKGTICEPSLLATIVTDKMQYGLPLYRQEQRFSSLGINLSRQAMSGWMMAVASSLKPLKEALERSVRKYPLWNVDETPLQVLRIEGEEEPKTCFMAVRVTTRRDFSKGPIIFDYLRNRTNAAIASLLNGYSHTVQSDGLGGYVYAAKSGSFTHIGCHVHARRKFADILKVQKNHKLAKEVIDLYAVFFHHEKELLEKQKGEHPLSETEYLSHRKEILGKDLEAIHTWLVKYKKVAIAKSPILTAIDYSLKRWDQLCSFLEIPYATSGNNCAENSIRPFVLARKGFLFAQSPQGAEASALYFSLTESCKAMGIDPHRYLTHLFSQAGRCKTEADWDKMIPGKADLSGVDDYYTLLSKAKVDPFKTEPYTLRGKRY